jgi:hypothetical protein
MLEKLKLWVITHKTEALVGAATLATLIFMGARKSPRKKSRRKIKITNKPRKVKRSYSKAPSLKKKPWQVKGSLAAKRRMAQIRRKKS